MLYVIVNGIKLPPMTHFCAHDSVEITEGYVRDLETGALYHNPYCLKQHRFVCQEAIDHVA